MNRYQQLMQQIEEKNNAATALIDAWGDSLPSAEQRAEVKRINDEIKELEKQAMDTREGDDLRKEVEARKKAASTPVDRIGFGMPGDMPTNNGNGASTKHNAVLEEYRKLGDTWGEAFTNHPDIKAWRERVMPFGASSNLGEKTRVQSPVIQLPIGMKSLITGLSDASAGAMVRTQYEDIVRLPFRPLTIRDLITIGRTGTDAIEYPRVVSQANNAAAVAEATATSGASGVKPESDLVLEKVQTTVKTIAHWIPISKRALADAGQIETVVNQFLLYGLEEELEDQIVAGDGAGENLTGILNTTGTLSQAFVTNIMTTTRKAVTKVKVTGKARPTAWVMHPNDWEAIDLTQDNEARYYYGGPMALGNPRLWGYPVVESEAMTEGTGMLGDWKQLVFWDRQQAGIQVTDSHQDFFIRNLVAMLAELRGGLGCLRPAAFVEVDLTA